MEIYLIRHTTPEIERSICYGQADIDLAASFLEEAERTREQIPSDIDAVYCSPAKRCRLLATRLFACHMINYDDRLKELNFGHWELLAWDAIDKTALNTWMEDFVNLPVPGGESYLQLHERVTDFLYSLPVIEKLAIVSHGGVIRSILSHINQVPLKASFDVFSIDYGCVIRLPIMVPDVQVPNFWNANNR